MYLAGGGIIGHPDGAAAGVASLREAWEAAVAGVSLERLRAGRVRRCAARSLTSGRR